MIPCFKFGVNKSMKMSEILKLFNENGKKPLDIVLLSNDIWEHEGYGRKGMKGSIVKAGREDDFIVVEISYAKFEGHNVHFECSDQSESDRKNNDFWYIAPEYQREMDNELMDLAEADPVFDAYKQNKQGYESYFQFLVREYREKILKS